MLALLYLFLAVLVIGGLGILGYKLYVTVATGGKVMDKAIETVEDAGNLVGIGCPTEDDEIKEYENAVGKHVQLFGYTSTSIK